MTTLLIVLIVHTALCVLAVLPAVGPRMAAVMGGTHGGPGRLGIFVAEAGFLFPAAPVLSVFGAWITLALGLEMGVWLFITLPWLYLGILLGAIGLLVVRR